MAIGVAAFGILTVALEAATVLLLALGFVLYGGVVVTYLIMTTSFPAQIRATAIGLCNTAGRIGAAMGPYLGGVALAQGVTQTVACALFALPALAAALLAMLSNGLAEE